MTNCDDIRTQLFKSKKANKIWMTIGIIALIGCITGFTLFGIALRVPPVIEDTFNPVIDGVWNAEENWDKHIGTSWMYAEYIVTDMEHMTTTNYVYVHLDLDTGLLYYLLDFVSDGTDDTTDEFLTWWYNGNDTFYDTFSNDISWNNVISDPDYSNEMFCFIPETETFNSTFDIFSYSYTTTLDETNVDMAFGFQNTTNARFEHRIFEFSVDINDLKFFKNGEKFDFAFLGYGTASTYITSGLWSAPVDLGYYLWDTGKIDEYLYFRCGTNTHTDLWNTPDEFELEDFIIL